MNYYLNAVLSYILAIPAIIGLVRFKKIDKAFYPFIYLLWVGLITEIVSRVFDRYYGTNAPVIIVFSLAEAGLILWLFYKIGLFEGRTRTFWVIAIIYLLAWITNFFLVSFDMFFSCFTILYSFLTVLMSIQMINKLILLERGKLLKNSVFLICTAFIAYFTLTVIVEIFWLYGISESFALARAVYFIQNYINLITNLVFIFAVIWIPKKLNYTLQ